MVYTQCIVIRLLGFYKKMNYLVILLLFFLQKHFETALKIITL